MNEEIETTEISDSSTEPNPAVFEKLTGQLIEEGKPKKRGRQKQPYSEFSKKELWEKLEAQNNSQLFSLFNPESVGAISNMSFHMLEKVTKLPYSQIDTELKKGFDENASNALNFYLADKIDSKATPALLVAFSFAMLTLNAVQLKQHQKPVERKVEQKEKVEAVENNPNLNAEDFSQFQYSK